MTTSAVEPKSLAQSYLGSGDRFEIDMASEVMQLLIYLGEFGILVTEIFV